MFNFYLWQGYYIHNNYSDNTTSFCDKICSYLLIMKPSRYFYSVIQILCHVMNDNVSHITKENM